MSPASAVVRAEVQPADLDVPADLPDYLVDTYSWAYLRPRSLRLLDRYLVVNGILWGNYHSLVRAACAEFAAGDCILQAASVYGDLSSRLADRVGEQGFLDVIDIAPVQVAHLRRKLAGRENVRVRVADAATPGRAGYDGACCFFLLHEVPDLQKRQIVNALLAAIRPGGKVLFVDARRPPPPPAARAPCTGTCQHGPHGRERLRFSRQRRRARDAAEPGTGAGEAEVEELRPGSS